MKLLPALASVSLLAACGYFSKNESKEPLAPAASPSPVPTGRRGNLDDGGEQMTPEPSASPSSSDGSQEPSDQQDSAPASATPATSATPVVASSPTPVSDASPIPSQAPTSEPVPEPTAIDGRDPLTPSPTATPALTYTELKPIIDRDCARCHNPSSDSDASASPLTSLDEIRLSRRAMIRKLEKAKMPPARPDYPTTDDGKKLLEWLRSGSDL